GASCTQGMVSSIPIVGSISPEGFLSLILLVVVIIATVVVTDGQINSTRIELPQVLLGLEFLLGLLVLAILVACASRVVATLSATSFLMTA
ncbi:hypothetical protein Tco_0141605, partial [Tanacetum coccineum]